MIRLQVFSTAWSAESARLAIAGRDKRIRVLDPRAPDQMSEGPSHDSARPARVLWLDSDHLISTGFSKSANREFRIYRVSANEIKLIGQQTLDISPAPLFPYYDPDTAILFLYAKGERTCLAYEVQVATGKASCTRLPSFDHGSLQVGLAFLPKRVVDISKVEVAVALRLTPQSIMRVGFSIPRARAEFFQDDIYKSTRDVEHSIASIDDWMQGISGQARYLDLNSSLLPLRT